MKANISPPNKKKTAAAVPPRKTVTTAAGSSQNGAKNSGSKAAAQSRGLPGALLSKATRAGERTGNAKGDNAGVRDLDPSTCQRSPFNREIDEEDPEFIELVKDVKKNGVLQNGIVRTAKNPKNPKILWEVIAGEGRWEAALRAKKPFPARVRECDDTECIEIQAIENMKRRNLNPIDEAIKYEQLLERYMREDQIGKVAAVEKIELKTGKSQASIYERLALMKLPEPVRKMVLKRKLPPSHAGLLTKLSDPSVIEGLAKNFTTPPPERADSGVLGYRECKQIVDAAHRREKNLADWQKERAKFEAAGGRVLTPTENDSWIQGREDGTWWSTNEDSPVVRAEEMCRLQGANYRTYEKLWKKPPPEILGRLPNGMPVIVYIRNLADEAVRAGGKLTKSHGNEGGGGSTGDVAKKRNQVKARREAFNQSLDALVRAVEDGGDTDLFLRTVGMHVVGKITSSRSRMQAVMKRRGLTGDHLDSHVEKGFASKELRGIIIESIAWHWAPYDFSHEFGKLFIDICGKWGVDPKAIESQLQTSGNAAPKAEKLLPAGKLSPANRAKLVASLKARWAARKKGGTDAKA